MPNSPFTPEQISQILEEFFRAVGTRQYIGARYIPIFGRKGEDTIQWDNTKPYEPLTIVLYQGNSYTSRQYVPVGVDITNTQFWASTGIYSAQIEQYRQEVLQFDGRITDCETGLADVTGDVDTLSDNLDTLRTDMETADDALEASILRGNPYYGQKSIGFGDSNMKGDEAGQENNTYRRITDYLHMTYDNRGVNGATIQTTGDKDIITQINDATADPEVKLVVFIGGINDYHYVEYNYANFRSAVQSCVTAIMEKFVNADIVLIFDQGKQHPNGRMLRYPEAMSTCVVMSRTRKIVAVPTFDMCFQESWYNSQNHWNGNGCAIVAQRACAYLTGGTPHKGMTYRAVVQPKSGVTGLSAVVHKIADLENYTIDQYADIRFETTFAPSAGFTELIELPISFDGNMPVGDKYIDLSINLGDSSLAYFNLRQFESNYTSVTDSPIILVRNRYATTCTVAQDMRLSVPLRPQQ